MKKKRGQVGMEYMLVVGFVTLAIMTVLALAFVYSDQIRDRIRLNQVEGFATQLINSAESTFFAGEPSKTTVRLYLPEGVQSVVIDENEDSIVFTISTSAGNNVIAYKSRVPIEGTISPGEGARTITLTATTDSLVIS